MAYNILILLEFNILIRQFKIRIIPVFPYAWFKKARGKAPELRQPALDSERVVADSGSGLG